MRRLVRQGLGDHGMKIVHEIYGVPQVTCSMRPYGSTPINERPRWNGARVECLIVDTKAPLKEDEAIYLEGDLNAVREALREVLDQLDNLEEIYKRMGEVEARRCIPCKNCGTWYDPSRLSNDPDDDNMSAHGDGKGNSCDGEKIVRWAPPLRFDNKPDEP